MSPELEEIIVRSDRFDIQDLLPEPGELDLDDVPGSHVWPLPCSGRSASGSGRAMRSTFPLGFNGRGGEPDKRRQGS